MTVQEACKKVKFLVQASDYERVMGHMKVYPDLEWKSVGNEFLKVGDLAGMPVIVTLAYFEVNGVLVVYADPASQVVDYRMLGEFYERHFPNLEGRPDAWNFHHVVQYIDKQKKK